MAETAKVISLGGLMTAMPASALIEQERDEARREADRQQARPVIQGLALHVREAWESARDAKREIEERMLKSARARRGEYDPDKKAAISEQGGSDVYAMLTSVKCRAAASWIRDVMLANGSEKPWTLRPTPVPDLPADMAETVVKRATAPIKEALMAGVPVADDQIAQMLLELKDEALNELRSRARQRAERMENKMEDQLIQGGFLDALHKFIDDIVTYPVAVLKGPVIRNKNVLQWVPQKDGKFSPDVQRTPVLEWERVSPFDIYPSANAETVDDGELIEKHRLSRADLQDLVGVEGYDEGAIRKVLEDYGKGGLHNWLYQDVGRAEAEGKPTTHWATNPDKLIDALQYWGSVQGQQLIDYGMTKDEISDPLREYPVEVWLVGSYVIKATLNYDPMGRKPYYKTSYEELPGSWWGNAPPDLIRDAQSVVNAASRALVNNMGIASGPQVVVNVDRLPPGENITQVRPWKIWQVTNDPIGQNAGSPIAFTQPSSNVQELMGIIRAFMDLADEWSGIPKYLTGDAPGGAGRTASGLSMLMSNAGKSLKQVIANIDHSVLKPMLDRQYYWNMRYGDDPEMKGDINIVVRGANALVAKEAAQVRRNEFLAATANPIDMQIVGIEGRAQVLREVVKGLDMDTDKIVPPQGTISKGVANLLAQQTAAAATPAPQPSIPQATSPSGQNLQDGAPVVDNFSPPPQVSM